MKITIDRFEGRFAVVELPDGSIENLPRSLVPEANEGDVITISISTEDTSNRHSQANDLLRKIQRKEG